MRAIGSRTSFCVLALLLLAATAAIKAQNGAPKGQWTTYGGDLGNTRYSALDQIDASNFSRLEVAWRFKTDNLGPRKEFTYQSTPLMAGGTLYSTGGSRRAVFALDAATGELRWVYGLNEGKRGEEAPRQLSGRGLSYWTDGKDERILYVTPGYMLSALDAKTGRPIPGFGKNGLVDLKAENDQIIDPITGEVGLHATPIVARNVVVVGAAHRSGGVPRGKENVKGYIRGYDVRTGKRLWIFHTIPTPGEFGNDTWLNDSWSYTGNTGVWGQMSVDEQLGLVYLPVETPTGDYFAANRPGNNLFAESLVAVDLMTGKRRWHYQFVHHGIWDYDIPCAPILLDLLVNGRTVKAVAQPTKQAFLYVFNRETGEPLWPMQERPVPKGDVPGEWYAATQPFPTKPAAAYDRHGVTTDDLIDFTPELRAEALKVVARYKIGPLFTPPVVSKAEGPLATLMSPGPGGGTNWPGGSYDPETQILYVGSNSGISSLGLVPPDPGQSGMAYIQGNALSGPRRTAGAGSLAGGGQRIAPPVAAASASAPAPAPPAAGGGDGGGAEGGASPSVQGLPLSKPPYGILAAIDMGKAEILWKIPNGETPDNIKNHPLLKGLDIPRTGRPASVGTLVTKTLLIAGEPGFSNRGGVRGSLLRAYNKATGADVGTVFMPAPQSGTPMTYFLNGEQYITVAISGGNYSGELLTFKLPASSKQ